MKYKMSRQATLKGLLLLALAANVSWNPALKSLIENDYASTASSDVGRTGGPRPGQTRGGGTQPSQSPNGLGPSESGVKPDAPAKPQGTDVLKVEEAPKVEESAPAPAPASAEKPKQNDTLASKYISHLGACEGKSFSVRYHQKQEANVDKTVATIYEDSVAVSSGGSNDVVFDDGGELDPAVFDSFSTKGTIGHWIGNGANRVRLEAALTKQIQSKLGDSCKRPLTAEEKRKTEAAEKARHSETAKKCETDDKGNDLNENQKVSCLIKRIDKISVSEKNGSESRRTAMSEIESIVNGPLKKHLKTRLLSRDESKVDEGNEFVDELVDTIETVSDSNDLDKNRTRRLVNGLKAMQEGTKFNRQSEEYADKAKGLKEDYRSAWRDYEEAYRLTKTDPVLRSNPWLAMQTLQNAAQPLNTLNWQHNMLSNQIDQTMAAGYRSLLQYQSLGALTALDMRDYVTPFRNLRQTLMGMQDPKSMGITGIGALPDNPYATSRLSQDPVLGVSLPGDFANVRGGASSQAFRRSFGVGITPQASTTNQMGNHGLSTMRLNNSSMPTPVFTSSSINIRPTTGYGSGGGRGTSFGF